MTEPDDQERAVKDWLRGQWMVSAWSRPIDYPQAGNLTVNGVDYAPIPSEWERGAVVVDAHNDVTYKATVARAAPGADPYLTHLVIEPHRGQRINGRFASRVPYAQIAEAVQDFLDAADADEDLVIEFRPARRRGEMPDLEELAERVRAGTPVDELMAEYDASRPTLYRWLAKARENGLLPEPTTGRPPKATAAKSGGKGTRPRATKKKEK